MPHSQNLLSIFANYSDFELNCATPRHATPHRLPCCHSGKTQCGTDTMTLGRSGMMRERRNGEREGGGGESDLGEGWHNTFTITPTIKCVIHTLQVT